MEAFIEFLKRIGLIFDFSRQQEFINDGSPFYVSFEGLGIGQFRLDPVAIPVLNGIRWYGIVITLGIILAFFYVAKWRAKDEGYHFDDILDFVLFVVPFGVLGARLFYVFSHGGFDYSNWFAIWDGGLAIYGGVIAGIVAIVIMGLIKKVRILRLMDCTAPAVMMAQAIGRWGNFFNGEAFGADTDSFLRMGLSFQKGGAQVFVHPTFLYESLWNLIGFALINVFFKKKKFDGQIVLEYLGWYGLGRFFIELLRQDSLPLHVGAYDLRISSVIGLLCFLVCLTLFLVFIFKPKSPALSQPCYYPGAKRLRLMEEERRKAEKVSVGENETPSPDAAPEPDGNAPESGGESPEEGEESAAESNIAAEEGGESAEEGAQENVSLQ